MTPADMSTGWGFGGGRRRRQKIFLGRPPKLGSPPPPPSYKSIIEEKDGRVIFNKTLGMFQIIDEFRALQEEQ